MKEIKKTMIPTEKLKPLYPDANKLVFGRLFTDYMFTLEYTKEKGWFNPEIKPYGPIPLEPSAMVFHYGQEVFEGQKAYLSPKDEILLFRPEENARRMNQSMRRMSIPEIDEKDFIYYESELLKLEKRWIPKSRGTSLYVRPCAIASEAALGVRPANKYIFFIILCPVGPFFKEGFNPVSLWVSRKYARASEGGTGSAKAGGNYGASLIAGKIADEKGYSQVLWLDGKEHRFAEEVGAMNIFFVINNQLVTPPLGDTILPGITRKSILKMASDIGITASERPISIEEVRDGIQTGEVTEIFGAGTAAVISPVGKINIDDRDYIINQNRPGPWATRLYQTLTDIQYGLKKDPYNWIYTVK